MCFQKYEKRHRIIASGQITLEELYAAHEGSLSSESTATNGHVNGMNGDDESAAMMRTFGGDRRLMMNGYTVETLNMLLLPMVTTKLVTLKNFATDCKNYIQSSCHGIIVIEKSLPIEFEGQPLT